MNLLKLLDTDNPPWEAIALVWVLALFAIWSAACVLTYIMILCGVDVTMQGTPWAISSIILIILWGVIEYGD